MPPQTEGTSEKAELFTGIEGIERGNALLEKLRELLPEEPIPDTAWEYGEFGEIIAIDYLKKLTMEVAMVGGQTEEIHSQLHKLIEAEKKICRFPEKLAEPNQTELSEIKNELEKFSAEEIERVSKIEEVADAKLDINRQLMNTVVNYYGPLLDKMTSTTRIFLDGEKTMFPEYWDLTTRIDAMRTAVGIIGRDSITRISRIKS